MSLEAVLHDYLPLVTAGLFFVFVFALGELSRKVVEKLFSRGSDAYAFFIEAIACAETCICAYENGIIITYYGPLGFFLAVVFLSIVGGHLGRGAFCTPLVPIENFYYRSMSLSKFVLIIVAQVLGGLAAFRSVIFLWSYSRSYFHLHSSLLSNTDCHIAYPIEFAWVVLFEIGACFFIRLAVSRLPNRTKELTIPILISGLLTFALVYVGVPALNPLVISSVMYGCKGLSSETFVVLYWLCPVIGWMAAAAFDRQGRRVKID